MDEFQTKPLTDTTTDPAGATPSGDIAVLTREDAPETDAAEDELTDLQTETDAAADETRDDLDVDHLTSDGVPFAGDAEERAEETVVEEDAPADHAAPEMSADNKVKVALKVLRSVEQQVKNAIHLLEEGQPTEAVITLGAVLPAPMKTTHETPATNGKPVEGRIVEGVFDGQAMVGADGKTYSVPPNYASKSKLVEGDMLKLTITPKGSFIYKQIGPIDRNRLMGVLGYDGSIGQYYAASENRRWNVLRASVTYFKGEPGDEVAMLVPKHSSSKWAAVENIIRKDPLE